MSIYHSLQLSATSVSVNRFTGILNNSDEMLLIVFPGTNSSTEGVVIPSCDSQPDILVSQEVRLQLTGVKSGIMTSKIHIFVFRRIIKYTSSITNWPEADL